MNFKIFMISLIVSANASAIQAKIETKSPDFYCPKYISSVEQIQSSPLHWEAVIDSSPKQLKSLSFYSGHPSEKAELKPDLINKKMAKWTFSASTSSKESVYIVCAYSSSSIQLTHALPLNTTQCTLHFNQNIMIEGAFIPLELTCTP